MENWVLSDAGDKWTVKLATRDLRKRGAYRRRAATLAGLVLGYLAAVLIVSSLHTYILLDNLGFRGLIFCLMPCMLLRGLGSFFLSFAEAEDSLCFSCLVQQDAISACWCCPVFVGGSTWL